MVDSSSTAVIAAILLPGALYIAVALKTRKQIKSAFEFFPLERYLPTEKVGTTVVAAGMSMATVMVALLNLAPLMGIALFVTVITFVSGFLLLSLGAPRILRANPENLVLQSFLGQQYSSSGVRLSATIFTIIGYLSIFSMEILVSVTILKPFFGNWILAFAVTYLAFLLVYTGLSGFRGVVETDRWQLTFIYLSLAALASYLLIANAGSTDNGLDYDSLHRLFTNWQAPVAFFVGIAVMNIPAPYSDAGTWQRICAAKSESNARSGLIRASGMFTLIWGALIVLGIFLSGSVEILHGWDASTDTLISRLLTVLGSGSFYYTGILFVLIVGLFSAMISTADSLLIAAAQVGITGFGDQKELVRSGAIGLRRSRWLVVFFGIGSFAIFISFFLLEFNVVQLVFAIYGAQLALFPTTIVALFAKERFHLHSLRVYAIGSVWAGFVTAWSTAAWGHFIGSSDLQFYAPAFGLAAATVVIIIGLPFTSKQIESTRSHGDQSQTGGCD